jgi:hypothetical protein
MLITVFARREPTRIPEARALERISPGCCKRLTDIAVYRDRECTQPFGRFGPDHSLRPRSSSKTVRLNCWSWALEWVAPLH